MLSTLDTKDHLGILALLKGESGMRKSTAALSFPRPYVFDFDRKMPGVALKQYPGKEIHWDTFDDVFEVEAKLAEFRESCPYETLIADSFTSLANLTISSVGQVKSESVPQILSRIQKTKGGSAQIEMMGIDYYSAEDRFCTYFIEQLKKLHARPGNPKHVLITAHVITTEGSPDLKTKIVTRTRSIVAKGRKVAAWLPTEFDNVWLFGYALPDLGSISDKVTWFVRTSAFGEDSAKCSLVLPETIMIKSNLYDEIQEILEWSKMPKGDKK